MKVVRYVLTGIFIAAIVVLMILSLVLRFINFNDKL